MIFGVQIWNKFVGTVFILPTLIANCIILHFLVVENLVRRMYVSKVIRGQMWNWIFIVDYSVNRRYSSLQKTDQSGISDSKTSEVVSERDFLGIFNR